MILIKHCKRRKIEDERVMNSGPAIHDVVIFPRPCARAALGFLGGLGVTA
jgi:hypothetical protein